jgi:hypothetical protein
MDGTQAGAQAVVPVSPAWQLAASKQRVRCSQCRQPIEEGELMAWHPLSRLAFHPACAGIASSGDVVSPTPIHVRPDERRAA